MAKDMSNYISYVNAETPEPTGPINLPSLWVAGYAAGVADTEKKYKALVAEVREVCGWDFDGENWALDNLREALRQLEGGTTCRHA